MKNTASNNKPSFYTTRVIFGLATSIALGLGYRANAQDFTGGDLLISRSVYAGDASTVTIGQALPGGGTANANGTYVTSVGSPNVFNNESPDPSFGVTSPIYLDQTTTSGSLVSSVNLTSEIQALTGSSVVTSFPSKSEIALNLSTDGSAVTFMGYLSPVNALDVSNSNTPNNVDPTDPVKSSVYRSVVQLNSDGTIQITPVNSYSGNNGRAAVLANNVNGSGANEYLSVGNAGNGSGTEPTNIVNDTGVQLSTPGGSPNTTVVGAQQGTPGSSKGFQYGFSVTSIGDTADKSGKDDNFRGETIFNNTLYVTKGSGGNGVNTVYKVGTAGSLPTAGSASSTAISILPGFNTALAANAATGPNPFGIWFANASTLYVADEGDGVAADAATSPYAGLEKWVFNGSVWQNVYTLTAGLNLGQAYGVSGSITSANGVVTSGSYAGVATDGLRNLTGEVNADGTVTLFGVTSTVSGNTDQGADPNEVVSITDTLADTTAAGEDFTTIDGPVYGNVYRGVSFTPVPEPSTWAILIVCAGLLIAWRPGKVKKGSNSR